MGGVTGHAFHSPSLVGSNVLLITITAKTAYQGLEKGCVRYYFFFFEEEILQLFKKKL